MKKEKKEPKRKPKYGMLSCVRWIYRLLWKYNKALVFVGISTVPVALSLSALGLWLPSVILLVLETSDRFSYVALVIIGIMAAQFILSLVDNVLSTKISNAEHHVCSRMLFMRMERILDRDYFLDLDPETKKIDERARKTAENNHAAGVHFPMDFSDMLARILKFLLFGTVISLLHPMIILLLAAGTLLNSQMSRFTRHENRRDIDRRASLDKKIHYCTFGISRDFKYAKDVRLYSMAEPIHRRLDSLFKDRESEQRKIESRGILNSLLSLAIVLIRDSAAYAFLIYKAVSGEVDASSFVLYFSAITAMAGLMEGILGTINGVFEGALQISDFRESLEIPDKLNRREGIPVPVAPFSIEFKNVSYKYPLGEKKVLDNISFKIEAGEKIALVGLNGAGKTTLTMLMCGLLIPDEGEVLLDGHPLTDYNRDEMYTLFGLVPQEYHLLPVSIARNIACTMTDSEIDHEKLRFCIETAGLSKKIDSLPLGVATPLNREVNDDAVELSGGETQKLLLARLLYKAPHCIILDEPTAALDPIAEDRIYRKYNDIAAHATSVFISHRLASTRFCDRIFLLDGARFAEVGTHDELLKLGGKYSELFDIQSKYYREGDNGDEE